MSAAEQMNMPLEEEPKAGKLEREGHLGIDVRAGDGDTLGIIAAGHTQHRREKIVNGAGSRTFVLSLGSRPAASAPTR